MYSYYSFDYYMARPCIICIFAEGRVKSGLMEAKRPYTIQREYFTQLTFFAAEYFTLASAKGVPEPRIEENRNIWAEKIIQASNLGLSHRDIELARKCGQEMVLDLRSKQGVLK